MRQRGVSLRSGFLLSLLRVGALSLVASLAGPATPQDTASAFQRALDRLDVPYEIPQQGKAILVNIPAFELIAFEKGMQAFRSRVIVGTPWTPTPLMETTTKTVRFRPTWRPTPSMVASGEYPDRVWPPGPENPLGLAAIRFSTNIPVYLHDTNKRHLFDEEMRALSHGCIRVELWDKLVAWTLSTDLAEVHKLANGSETIDIDTPAIPVRLGYFLTFPGDTGQPVRYADVYAREMTFLSGENGHAQAQNLCGSSPD